jgi:hypothetical protein
MHLKSRPIKGSKLADGTSVIDITIIGQGWSKPLLTGTKLGKPFSHYYQDNVSIVVERKRKERVGAGNGEGQWRWWQSALDKVVKNRKQDDIPATY